MTRQLSKLMTMLSRTALTVGLMALLTVSALGQVGRSGLVGTAVDEEGQPMANLELVLKPAGETAGRDQVIKTNRRGQFANRFLTSGRYVVEVKEKNEFFIKNAKVDIKDAGGVLLSEYEITTHPTQGLTAIPIQGGQITEVQLVITSAAYREGLVRQIEGSSVNAEVGELVRLLNAGELEQALVVGHQIMDATTTELPDVLHLVGLTYERLDREAEAEPLLRRAVELAPDQPELKASLGTMLLDVARKKQSREEDSRAEFTEAEEWLGQAVSSMDPVPTALLVNHSIALEGAGRPEAAIEVMERIAAEDPDNLPVRFRMAALLRTLGQPERALEVLSSLPGAGDPRAVDSLYNIGLTFYNEEDYTSALAALKRAEEIDPDHGLIQRLLGRTYYAAGKPGEAIAHLRRFVELEPDHPEVELEREMIRHLETTTGRK